MVEFIFTVNASLLTYPTRPITIPKQRYAQLETERLAGFDVTIVRPNGASLEGFIY